MKKLSEVFDTFAEEAGALFKSIATNYPEECPWALDLCGSMDMEYFTNRAGDKLISPLVEAILGNDDTLSSVKIQRIAKICVDKYSTNWSKKYATLSLVYNPIENYSMEENHTGSDTETETPTGWKKVDVETPTDWKTKTSGADTDNGEETNRSVNGFNSTTPSDAEKTTRKVKTDLETEQTGTYRRESEQEGTNEKATEYNTTLKRSGNIGVTTSQQMIESERKLYDWNFINSIYTDVDTLLTLSIY